MAHLSLCLRKIWFWDCIILPNFVRVRWVKDWNSMVPKKPKSLTTKVKFRCTLRYRSLWKMSIRTVISSSTWSRILRWVVYWLISMCLRRSAMSMKSFLRNRCAILSVRWLKFAVWHVRLSSLTISRTWVTTWHSREVCPSIWVMCSFRPKKRLWLPKVTPRWNR